MKGVCSVVREVKRPYRENENTEIMERKMVVTLLASYSKCSMFCAQTVKHPTLGFVAVFFRIEEKYNRIRISILPQHSQ